jgi:beta-lactam-binding protein with PASTA domain/tRNA A-37 threonylcarbamoyl transferase component Bud32
VGGRYRLLAPLGSGASAEVYLADDVRLRRRVAVKLLRAVLADDEGFLRRFRAEARAAAALSHPNIVAIFDWNGEEVPPYLVTEYLSGGSLRSILDAGHRLSPSQALLVGLQAAQALDHAHRQGFVHRDIKPANLLFGGDARLRIADFGLARAIAEAGWTEPTGAVLGTARYSSPEQVRGEPLDGRSDIYSLALVMIEAVTGTVPFSADTTIGTLMARLDREIPVPEELGALQPFVARAGSPLASERPEAATLVNDLMDAATELPRPAALTLVGATGQRRDGGDGADGQDRTLHGAAVAMPGNGDVAGAPPGPGAPTGHVPAHMAQPPALNGGDGDRTMIHARPAGLAPGPSGGFVPPEVLPRGRRDVRAWAVRIAAVVAAIALGAVGTWLFQQWRIPSHEVPQTLIGAQEDEIDNLVEEFGWRINREEVFRDGTEAGVVLETVPAPGRRLREGEELVVRISRGPTQVTVPTDDQLAGLSQDQADGLLRAAGVELVPEFVPTPSDDVDEGEVIGLEEGTPEHLPKGSTVRVLVSSGDDPFDLPDVRGWNADDAQAELERLGLNVEQEDDFTDDLGEGQVIRTEPRRNREVEPGDTVTIVVNTGDEEDGGSVQVPDVTGMSVDDAREELEDEGLVVGQVQGPQDGDVVTTLPRPNREVESGTEVTLWTF